MLTGELHEGRSFLVAFGRREYQHTEREDREQRRGRTKNKKKTRNETKKKNVADGDRSLSRSTLPPPLQNPHLGRDERDELAHALLHRLLRVLGDLGVGRQRLLHYASDVGDGKVLVLLLGPFLLG